MSRNPDGEDAVPTSGPAPERHRAPGRTDLIVAKAVQAARSTVAAMPADNDQQSIAALASIVNRALLLVGLVVLVLGGLVGVGVSIRGMGTTITTTATSPGGGAAAQPAPSPVPAAVPAAPGGVP